MLWKIEERPIAAGYSETIDCLAVVLVCDFEPVWWPSIARDIESFCYTFAEGWFFARGWLCLTGLLGGFFWQALRWLVRA